MRIPDDPTPFTCFEQVKPCCDEILRLTRSAPLSEKERAGLSTIVAVHFFGAAIADQRRALGEDRPISAIARDLLEMIISDLALADRPKLVAPRSGSETEDAPRKVDNHD